MKNNLIFNFYLSQQVSWNKPSYGNENRIAKSNEYRVFSVGSKLCWGGQLSFLLSNNEKYMRTHKGACLLLWLLTPWQHEYVLVAS